MIGQRILDPAQPVLPSVIDLLSQSFIYLSPSLTGHRRLMRPSDTTLLIGQRVLRRFQPALPSPLGNLCTSLLPVRLSCPPTACYPIIPSHVIFCRSQFLLVDESLLVSGPPSSPLFYRVPERDAAIPCHLTWSSCATLLMGWQLVALFKPTPLPPSRSPSCARSLTRRILRHVTPSPIFSRTL